MLATFSALTRTTVPLEAALLIKVCALVVSANPTTVPVAVVGFNRFGAAIFQSLPKH
jgi:hypothetical protein